MNKRGKAASLSRRIILWSTVLLGLAGISLLIFSIAVSRKVPPPAETVGTPPVPAVTVSPDDWSKGFPRASAVLVEYSDFQCPACGAYYPIVKRLFEEFGDRMRFVYRHFPLIQHTHAELAARAAEAAGRQGKFWEMHDRIFETQKEWSELQDAGETFMGFAREMGLDLDRFQADRDSPEILQSIAEDYNSGLAAKVQGTPTFYLNGREIENPRSHQDFRNVIRKALP